MLKVQSIPLAGVGQWQGDRERKVSKGVVGTDKYRDESHQMQRGKDGDQGQSQPMESPVSAPLGSVVSSLDEHDVTVICH